MADPEHLDKIKAGAEEWNSWRFKKALRFWARSEFYLSGADFTGVNDDHPEMAPRGNRLAEPNEF